jgi:hypothetical protein
MVKRIALSALLSISANAQVEYIEKGKPAPYTGYLFTPEKEADVRKANEDLKLFKLIDDNNSKILKLKEDQLVVVKEQADLWKNQSERLSKQLVDAEDRGFWRNTLYFGLGAIVTTAIVFGVNQASK